MKLKRNMCKLDKFLRVGLGILLIYFALIDQSLFQDVFFSILICGFGIFNLLVAIKGHCPIYKLAGISTLSSEQLDEIQK